MVKLPSYSDLWVFYPDYIFYPDSKMVKKNIGGSVDANWLTNTCAIRLSHTLNLNGILVPWGYPHLYTVKGGNGKRYAIRVREMRKWMFYKLGKPQFDVKKKEGSAFDKKQISSMQGIIGFDIRFSDATGHLDLWNGNRFSSEHNTSKDYFSSATRIWIWTAK